MIKNIKNRLKKVLCLAFLIVSGIAFSEQLYWENPSPLPGTSTTARFPTALSGTTKHSSSAIFYEDVDFAAHQLYVSMATTSNGLRWNSARRIVGPFYYSGEVPEVYSVCANNSGTWALAALTDTNEISVYTSVDSGNNFSKYVFPEYESPLIAPRIYATKNGGFLLFVSFAKNEEFTILYSTSQDGMTWSDFTSFDAPSTYSNSTSPFVPFLLSTSGGDVVIYQARYASSGQLSFQLFSTVSTDGGATWSPPRMLTDSQALIDGDRYTFDRYNNQRPYAFNYKNTIYLAWERKAFSASTSDAMVCTLGSSGEFKGKVTKLNSSGNSSRPSIFAYKNTLYSLWFDSQRGNEGVYISTMTGSIWDDPKLISSGRSTFPSAVLCSNSSTLNFVWQDTEGSATRIHQLLPDTTTKPPVLEPLNFTKDNRSKESSCRIKISSSEDSSGVQGFSYIWTRNDKDEPPSKINSVNVQVAVDNAADSDGEWYFKAKQLDYAGNWSSTSTLVFNRDTTPPLAPVLSEYEKDGIGLPKSNSIKLFWEQSPEDPDLIAGWTWSIEYIDSIPQRLTENRFHPLRMQHEEAQLLVETIIASNQQSLLDAQEPPRYIRQSLKENSTGFSNRRNGVYVFSVAAVDTVGNIGPSTKQIVILNKYNPQTFITAVNSKLDGEKNTVLEIIGGGFTYEGTVTTVYVDKDGVAPFDYVYTTADKDFTVNSDSRISGLTLKELEAGDYRVGIIHPERGIYFTSSPVINIEEYGTVKVRDKYSLNSSWKTIQEIYKRNTNISTIILIALLIFFVIGTAGAIIGLLGTAREAKTVMSEVDALLKGDAMPGETKVKTKMLKKRGLGLGFKLTMNSMLLVIAVAMLLIYTFRVILTTSEEQTLSKGLYDRTNIIMDSIESGTKIYLPLSTTGDNLSLQDTANQVSALSEAKFATITGFSEDAENISMDYVWATTDKTIASKIDNGEYIYGESRIVQKDFTDIISKVLGLNAIAAERLGDIPTQISEVTREASSLLGKNDSDSAKRREELDEIRKQLNTRLESILNEISVEGTGSVPEFNPQKIDYDNTDYIFYKPVLYRQGNDQTYVHGLIFIQISTSNLIQEVEDAKRNISRISIIMIIVAIIFAFIASLFISSIIVRPINKLAAHVARIRDTEDKEKLEGHDIKIRSRDEIGTLGDTVNEMTHGLVEAAKASKNLTLGKEIQTRFIPLKTDDFGNTLTTGELKAPGADFFSYYAGADELSGDYFDYKQIDKDHFAIIKCDVSGHGVPAALIMVEVATLFLNYFNHWDMKNPRQGTNLSPVVGQINDLLESRGFKGRFAAFTLAILNSTTGECYFCNAGDNQVHIYDSLTRKKKLITLQETPAAGMFSTDLVDMKGGYKVSKLTLKKNDVLFLYTDGIEEAKRLIRNSEGKILRSDGTNRDEEKNEEFSPERVTEIIESVFDQKTYTLVKDKDGEQKTEYVFDFTHSPQDAETAIMALVSIEKVFRLYKNPKPVGNEKVKVDRKIDEFLRQYFKNYGDWCSERGEVENDPTTLYYYGICEDPQYDDLTLVSVRKK